jgi:hypothetical protein
LTLLAILVICLQPHPFENSGDKAVSNLKKIFELFKKGDHVAISQELRYKNWSVLSKGEIAMRGQRKKAKAKIKGDEENEKY